MLFRASAFSIWDATWRFCALVAAAARAHVERNERQEQKSRRDRRGKAAENKLVTIINASLVRKPSPLGGYKAIFYIDAQEID